MASSSFHAASIYGFFVDFVDVIMDNSLDEFLSSSKSTDKNSAINTDSSCFASFLKIVSVTI